MIRRSLAFFLFASALSAYTDGIRGPGLPPTRNANPESIGFIVDSSAAAGVRNSTGDVLITEDSDPVAAIRAGAERWNAIAGSRVHFDRFDPGTAEVIAGSDRQDVITFRDTATTRSLAGDATAVTSFFFTSSPTAITIVESDIVFNPDIRDGDGTHMPFSTTGQRGTFDIEATIAHEYGHVLGAKHTAVAGGTMWQDGRAGDIFARTLTPDDEMFAIQAYPQPGALGRLGRIRGFARREGGSPLRGALVVAVDPNGAVVSSLSDLITGEYEILVPPGEYFVYADPANGPLASSGLRLLDEQIDIDFATTLFGGNDSPATVSIPAGGIASADLIAPAGEPPLEIAFVGERDGAFILVGNGPREIPVNQSSELFLWGAGLADVEESNVRVLGPEVSLVPGSVSVSPSIEFRGFPALRLTVRPTRPSAPTQSTGAGSLATILITRQGMAAAYTGGIVLEGLAAPGPAPAFFSGSVTNAASFATGPVAPGELISIFGQDLGPAAAVSTPGFGPNGLLPTTLSEVQVTFDGLPAPLVFVSANQINAQVPYEVAGQSSTAAVVTYQGRISPNVTLPVAASAPGVFFRAPGAPAILNQDGSLNSPANPEARGRVVVVFATGQGVVSPPVATGRGAPSAPLSGLTEVSATIGGRPATPLFAGLTPGFVGLLQVNLLVPDDAPTGAQVPVFITLRGQTTQSDVNVSIAP